MDLITVWVLVVGVGASLGGVTVLCLALDRRNRQEARRELFGLPIGEHSWP